MADNYGISWLKENGRKFFEMTNRKGNSGEIMKEKNKKRKLQDKQPVAANITNYVSNRDEKKKKKKKKKTCILITWTKRNYVLMRK